MKEKHVDRAKPTGAGACASPCNSVCNDYRKLRTEWLAKGSGTNSLARRCVPSLFCLLARILPIHRTRQPGAVFRIVRRYLGHAIIGVGFVGLDGNEQV